jgi:hypothetical protein
MLVLHTLVIVLFEPRSQVVVSSSELPTSDSSAVVQTRLVIALTFRISATRLTIQLFVGFQVLIGVSVCLSSDLDRMFHFLNRLRHSSFSKSDLLDNIIMILDVPSTSFEVGCFVFSHLG